MTTRKYIVQVLLEAELEAGDRVTAEVEGKVFADTLQKHSDEHWNRKIELINTSILTDPSDEEFLSKLFEYRGEIYEMVD